MELKFYRCLRVELLNDPFFRHAIRPFSKYLQSIMDKVGFVGIKLVMKSICFNILSYIFRIHLMTSYIHTKPTWSPITVKEVPLFTYPLCG